MGRNSGDTRIAVAQYGTTVPVFEGHAEIDGKLHVSSVSKTLRAGDSIPVDDLVESFVNSDLEGVLILVEPAEAEETEEPAQNDSEDDATGAADEAEVDADEAEADAPAEDAPAEDEAAAADASEDAAEEVDSEATEASEDAQV